MNQQMDLDAIMQDYVSRVTSRIASMIMLDLILAVVPGERKRLKDTLNREPTRDDWDDYCQFLGERLLDQKCLQRAIDREKIRQLVFGEANSNLKSG